MNSMSGSPLSTAEVSQIVRAAGQRLVDEFAPLLARATAGSLDDEAYPLVEQAIHHSLDSLATTGLWGPVNRVPSSELWNLTGPILERSLLINRARTKPRGYAGDYEMLAWIHENRRCDDPIGRLLDRYFQEQAAPQAVRNRMQMMAQAICQAANDPHPGPLPRGEGEWPHPGPLSAGERDQPLRIAVVGSAFGMEVRAALAALDEGKRRHLSVLLLDMDPAALDFARGQLEPLLPPEQLTIAAENLFRLPERPKAAARLEGTDLLFCPGLFDYLDDATATAMLRAFWQRLAPRGRLWVFQFAPHNPTRAYMEWLGNWYLTYRTNGDLRQLAAAAGIRPEAITLGAEPLGVDLLLTARRD